MKKIKKRDKKGEKETRHCEEPSEAKATKQSLTGQSTRKKTKKKV
jgi:hypothetical protein